MPNRNIWGLLAAAVLLLALIWVMNQSNTDKINPNELSKKDSTRINDSLKLLRESIENNPIAEEKEKKDLENDRNKIDEQKKPPIEEKKNILPKDLLAYEPNISLEAMIEGKRRGTDEPALSKILPDNAVKPKNEITFSWEQNTNRLDLVIEILDNKNVTVKPYKVPKGERKWVADLKELKNGLYYWRILDEENGNMMHVGKFELTR